MDTPYKGLQPYTELDKDNFYGRATEKRILIDKVLIHKLTFLFAASGVGKSSLLRAAVLPALTDAEDGEQYDVVYYNDWVDQPLLGLKSHIAAVLRDSGRVTADFEFDTALSLKEFLRICTIFTSAPFILILDQFEEFFNYQKYHQDNFKQFVKEIAEAIHDNETDTAFAIAMREDFALELNAFKEAMPTFLIDNFYRLERLSLANARMAIEVPLEKLGFCYEAGLLDALVHDLSEREKVEREGSQSQEWVMAELVEPPHLQIVCQQLWELDRGRADKEVKRATYERKGLAVGLLKNYFENRIEGFSYTQKKVASDAFNYLVNKHGTKMAYPLPDLAKQINKPEDDLQAVLDKLEAARVLRRQKRKETLWYELYHDMFSRSIYDWNEQFKFRHRMYRIGQGFVALVFAGALVFGIYDYWDNRTHYHVKVNFAEGVNAPVQVWQGRHDGFDIWGQHTFLHELSYSRADIEPDKLFDVQGVWDIEHVHQEMIEELPLMERVQAYYDAGYLDKAVYDVANCAIHESDLVRSKQFADVLTTLNVKEGIHLLIDRFFEGNREFSSRISGSLYTVPYLPFFLAEDILDTVSDEQIRYLTINYVAALGGKQAEQLLIDLLTVDIDGTQGNAIKKLATLKVKRAIPRLLKLLETDEKFATNVIDALEKIGDESVIPILHGLLESKEYEAVRLEIIRALLELRDKSVLPYTSILLNHSEPSVRSQAVESIAYLKDQQALPLITPLLNDSNSDVRLSTVDAVKYLGDKRTLSLITPLLNDFNSDVRLRTIDTIVSLNEQQALPLIAPLLNDHDPDVSSLHGRYYNVFRQSTRFNLHCAFTQ